MRNDDLRARPAQRAPPENRRRRMTQSTGAPRARSKRLLSAARNLQSPNSELLGQGVRFILAGGVVVVVYVSITTVLAEVVGMHFQVALAIGFGIALIVQFNLYRVF